MATSHFDESEAQEEEAVKSKLETDISKSGQLGMRIQVKVKNDREKRNKLYHAYGMKRDRRIIICKGKGEYPLAPWIQQTVTIHVLQPCLMPCFFTTAARSPGDLSLK